ncbi:MAG: cytochrome b/b6 domain-containing protein [Planctomycetota bacterium]
MRYSREQSQPPNKSRSAHNSRTSDHLDNPAVRWILIIVTIVLTALTARAQDPENCLSCHRFRGLSRLDPDTNELRLFFCDAEYYIYREGQHARVHCTGCHEKSEVTVIPHEVKTRVDCAQTCHIIQATGLAMRFSHQRVAESLSRSVHAAERLAELEFDPPLLRPGQSVCLYCHEQPMFTLDDEALAAFSAHSGGTRCDTCHKEELPLEIAYFAHHVSSRMKPSRTVQQLAQACAVCHSNARIIEQTDSHDAVASYFHSFHGKANLLGSTETATCVECHSSNFGDQHLMLSSDVAESATNSAQLSDTCRTTACHPGAPPEMSNAAVHLEIDPAQRTPEFYVAAFFIIMTATVMAIFFLMVILELVNTALRPTDPEYHRLVALARQLQAHPDGREMVQRMSVHERLQHWAMAIPFILLVITGMPIKFAEHGWAHTLITMCGGLTPARVIHRVAGITLIAVFFYHIVSLLLVLFWQMRHERQQGTRTPLWKKIYDAPMMLRPDDARDFFQLMAHLLFLRRARPRFGRFNFNEKFEYWAVFWGMPVMGLSGLALWGMPAVSEALSGRAINFAFIIHSDEAFLAFIYIAAIHLFSVILAPAVFPLSLGTLSGQAPADELVEGHRRDLERIAAELNVTVPESTHPHTGGLDRLSKFGRNLLRRAYSLAVAGAYAIVAFIALRFLILMLVTRQTAPVEIIDIPTRLDADVFFAAAMSVEHQPASVHRARGPLAHFHQIPQWFQPDPGNTCTTAGCHSPLPHGKRVEVRAFLNMHATFVDCTVCHAQAAEESHEAHWFSLADRQPTDTPAILRLAARLEDLEEVQPDQAEALRDELIGLLREALPVAGNHRQLQDWLLRLATTHPRNRAFNFIVDDMRDNIHIHVHGEYGAKIGLFVDGQLLGAPSPAKQAAIRDFLKRRADMSAAERDATFKTLCKGIIPSGTMCTPCHSANPTLIDMATVGYAAKRVLELSNSSITRSIISIEQGQPFYLPLDTDNATP